MIARVRVLLVLSGLVFLGAGLAFLLYPATVQWVDLELPTPAAAGDIRAVFGGLEVGLGLFLLWSAFWPGWLAPGLAVQVLGFGGLVLGRFMGLAIEGWPGLVSLALLAAELVGLCLGLLAATRWLREVPPQAGIEAAQPGERPDEAP